MSTVTTLPPNPPAEKAPARARGPGNAVHDRRSLAVVGIAAAAGGWYYYDQGAITKATERRGRGRGA